MKNFCEKLADLIESAPNEKAQAALEALRDELCGGVTNDTGNDGPPPKQP